MEFAECPFLEGQICFDVHVGGGQAFVAKPQSNYGDVDAGLQKVHRRRVTKRVRGYPPDKQEKATQTVLEQAELLCADVTVGGD